MSSSEEEFNLLNHDILQREPNTIYVCKKCGINILISSDYKINSLIKRYNIFIKDKYVHVSPSCEEVLMESALK